MKARPAGVSLFRDPSAYIPMAMSLAALLLLLGHIAIYGVVRQADEGTAAHVYQLLMAGQLPIVAFFAVKWLPRAPLEALKVLAIQLLAALASFGPLYYFHL